ncbi:class I SAM-dependent DNA methyltransferase [Rhodococcus ruber]
MTDNRLLDLVDARDFRTLFIDELGWNNPDRPDLTVEVDDGTFTLQQVAGYKGLRIWHCPVLPPRKAQRQIDVLVGKDSQERLIIFTNDQRQEWRWPRRAQLGSANAKLLVHEHFVGDHNTHLNQRLKVIELDFDEDLSLVALLEKMRDAFDLEAETASVAAARLMGTLYAELEAVKLNEHDATLLLARLLFLLFGDDADMWKPADLFGRFLRNHTTAETLHTCLQELFEVLDTPGSQRAISAGSPYAQFRYVNGGLYADPLTINKLTPKFRDALLDACEFDWSIISPAVFGSMFQTVKSRDARRAGGEHYTTEQNILKTIRPLFLDEYTSRLEKAWNDKSQLTKLHNDLSRLRFLDPACGCGNFLIVAYRELRALELEILKRRRDLDLLDNTSIKSAGVDRAQLSLDVSSEIKVTLDHFFGIEIEEWPARIAETAMLLVDHLANQRMAQEFGEAPDRLPITIAPTIVNGNALLIEWDEVVPPSESVIILGNPPYRGDRQMSAEQKIELRRAWGGRLTGHLDMVTGWFAKAMDYYGHHAGRWGFVATNSICQGEPAAELWEPIIERGWRCRFAHRSFQWESEASGAAVVHVSIVGFDRAKNPKPRLWVYPAGGQGEPAEYSVPNINPYLSEGPNVLVFKKMDGPFDPRLPQVVFGNMARDNGFLIVEPEAYDRVSNDPVARKYLRRFIGAEELLHNKDRWCLWMTDLDPLDVERSAIIHERVEGVRRARLDSKAPSTRKMAQTPHLFAQRTQPEGEFLAIPKTVSEHRPYLPVARFSSQVKASDATFTAADPEGYAFGVLSSAMFMSWMKAVGGRLKSDLRFSKTFTYNTFPMRETSPRIRKLIIDAASEVEAARARYSEISLANLYTPRLMPSALARAHDELDKAVDTAFGVSNISTESERQKILFRSYAELKEQGGGANQTKLL